MIEIYHEIIIITNSNKKSFIGYITSTVKKLTIYFKSHIHIDEQITNIIPKWMHVFVQDCGAYKHKNARFIFWHIFFTEIILNTTIYWLWYL